MAKKIAVKIIADTDSGEAEVVMADWFKEEGNLFKFDILQDALDALRVMSGEAYKEMHTEFEEIRKEGLTT
tara:strand:+ start:902 stop:1114 length:213 start_codon:yes stop_codon:yes gene_type:complete